METFFHISEVYNRKSILKNGILPGKINLNHHLEAFIEDGILQENENKIIYFFQDSNYNEKFLKDMVFCKVWIQPRNELANILKEDFDNYRLDYSKYKNKLLYKYDKIKFDIYRVIKIKEPVLNYRPEHVQISDSENIYNSLYAMPIEFEHDNKILAFSKVVERNIKIIGQLQFEFTKNKQYKIKLLKNKI